MNVLLLYIEFFAIGIFSIGGGLATLPFIYRLAGKYPWLEAAQIPDMLAVAQLLPGAMGVNLGAYVGIHAADVAGAFVAASGLVSAPVMIIIVIARLYDDFKKNQAVQSVFEGLRPAAAGLLASAGYGVLKLAFYRQGAGVWYQSIKLQECFISVIFYILLAHFKKLPTVLFIVAGALAGIILKL
ncbi:MAG: chromate transporter [Spirochaetaceae bacterium]|jgi:chromate transporter|nr:chromate transporter [Spirochaetaceae bacterium]